MHLFLKYGKTRTPNKYWEVEVTATHPKHLNWSYWNIQPFLHDEQNIISSCISLGGALQIDVSWTRNRDHAGAYAQISVLGLELNATVYDNRHWNYEENTWEK